MVGENIDWLGIQRCSGKNHTIKGELDHSKLLVKGTNSEQIQPMVQGAGQLAGNFGESKGRLFGGGSSFVLD